MVEKNVFHLLLHSNVCNIFKDHLADWSGYSKLLIVNDGIDNGDSKFVYLL